MQDKLGFGCLVSFLSVRVNILTSSLSGSLSISCILMKAKQTLFFLRRLKSFGFGTKILVNFYCTTESILTGCIMLWMSNITTECCIGLCKQLWRLWAHIFPTCNPSASAIARRGPSPSSGMPYCLHIPAFWKAPHHWLQGRLLSQSYNDAK